MKFDIKIVLEDMKVAIQKNKIDIIPYQLNLIYLYLETLGYEATRYFPLYITIKGEIPEELRKLIEKYREGKKSIVLKNGLVIYYSDDLSEILVEEEKPKRQLYNWLLIKYPAK